MASAPILRTSESLIADYLHRHKVKCRLPEVTNACHQNCIQIFEKIRTAAKKAEPVPARRYEIKVTIKESSDLIDAIQVMFFEKHGLKIKLEQDKESTSYHIEIQWIEADLEKFLRDSTKDSFDRFRNSVLFNQEKSSPYQRPELTFVSEKTITRPITIEQPPKGIDLYAKATTCYGWNAEGICDYGWGCAWRAIQTCLSSCGIKITFRDLFHKFGSLENLRTIYQHKYPNEVLNSSNKFAPHDTSKGWAEPFIGEMVMHFFDIPADLESLNGIPKDCNAPREVFHRPAMSFAQFKERLENHFNRENAAPVMIDDACYSYTIVGAGCQELNFSLWIADPYIKEGVNRNQQGNSPIGLYTITLDSRGKQIRCSLSEEDQHQKSYMHNAQGHLALKFDEKPWMILFPK